MRKGPRTRSRPGPSRKSTAGTSSSRTCGTDAGAQRPRKREITYMTSNRILGLAVVAVMMATSAAQAASKTSLKCRAAIAKQAANGKSGMIKRGLASLDACHKKQDKGKFPGDCNAVSVAAQLPKFNAVVTRLCAADDPVRK